MPHLARHLQDSFERNCPKGWVCRSEVNVVSDELAEMLGYAPQADAMLQEGLGGVGSEPGGSGGEPRKICNGSSCISYAADRFLRFHGESSCGAGAKQSGRTHGGADASHRNAGIPNAVTAQYRRG